MRYGCKIYVKKAQGKREGQYKRTELTSMGRPVKTSDVK
jgi:hypothetical protein